MATVTLALPETEQRSEQSTVRFYRPELDCLRFFAFFAVFITHTFDQDPAYYAARHVPFGTLVANAATAGRFGVDLFFLLSAYLITELLLREQQQRGKVDLRSFYTRRILRIWPLYFFGILIAVLLPFFDREQYFPPRYAIAFVMMSGNWLGFLGVHLNSVMWVLWSVSFEEQFYLLWPTFISRARNGKALLYACGVLLATATISRHLFLSYAPHRTVDAAFSFSLTRLDPLALGIATAVVFRKWKPPSSGAARLAFLTLGLSLLVLAGHFYHHLSRAFLLLGYPAVAVAAWLIFVSVYGFSWTPAWLRYLGKISYGLYVFHELVMYLTAKLFRGGIHDLRAFVPYWCIGLGLTIAVSTLSYEFFEAPFLKLKERFSYVKSRPV